MDKATQRKRTSRRRDQASTEGVVQNQRIHDTRGVACPRRSDIGGRGYPRRWSRIESRARHACSLRREVLRSNPAKTCVVLTVTGPQVQVWSRAMLVIFLRNRWVSRERSLYQALSGRGLTQVLRIGGGGRGAPSLYLQRRCLGLTQDKVQYVSFVCHKDQIENTWKEVECL